MKLSENRLESVYSNLPSTDYEYTKSSHGETKFKPTSNLKSASTASRKVTINLDQY